jgi:ADP-ribose pyrophosphatase YjhB (NUDIX family)
MMGPAAQLALWAEKLRDISAMGLRFSENFHDREAFHAVQTTAMEMFAAAVGVSFAQLEPLRAEIFARPTPIVVADGAVIDGDGRLLLIQRADNGKWAMPGGALMVGETPAEGVVREVLEETGVPCRATALVGVFDSRLCGTESAHHLYHFLFLCEPLAERDPAKQSHALEVLDVGWFPEQALPAAVDPGHVTRIPTVFRMWHGATGAYFDPPPAQSEKQGGTEPR